MTSMCSIQIAKTWRTECNGRIQRQDSARISHTTCIHLHCNHSSPNDYHLYPHIHTTLIIPQSNLLVTQSPSPSSDMSILPSHDFFMLLHREFRILCKTHLARVSRVWDPFGRFARGRFLHHSVDLFKGKTLGFPYQEVGVDEAEDTSRTPKEEDLGTEIGFVRTDEVGGDDCDNAVPEPTVKVRSASA